MSLLTRDGKKLKRKYRAICRLNTVLLDYLADQGLIRKFDGRALSESCYIDHFTGSVNLFDNQVKCEYDLHISYEREARQINYEEPISGEETLRSAHEWRLCPENIVGRVNFKILKLNYSLGDDEYHINLDRLPEPASHIVPCYIPVKYGDEVSMVQVDKVDLEEKFDEVNKITFTIQKCGMSINIPVFASKSYNDSDVLIFSKRQQRRFEEEMICDLCKTEINKIIQDQCPTFETIERMALGGPTLQEAIDKKVRELGAV